MWHYNKKVVATWAHHTSSLVYANIEGIGWRRIKEGASDGCTNLFVLFNAAKANDRTVHVQIDGTDKITTAYMV
ncbi:peptidase M6 [Fodinibius sediminis]|uniref:Uncharacterized protein n=1 Tax=Fodinibius sediminis TaxID=1214077 RepID=A0A521CGJ9_9BACT|nr:peptidase M6 [Fodinibius sediminis]SMO58495.1 hypothetical protein SAMN06265218_10657 [Fodinibius sediminis]